MGLHRVEVRGAGGYQRALEGEEFRGVLCSGPCHSVSVRTL